MFKKNFKKTALLSFLLLSMSTVVSAQTPVDEAGPITVTSIGVQTLSTALAASVGTPEDVVFFRRAAGWQGGCSFGVMYFDPTTPTGKNFYAMLLTARAADLALDRVVYTATPNAAGGITCIADQIISIQ